MLPITPYPSLQACKLTSLIQAFLSSPRRNTVLQCTALKLLQWLLQIGLCIHKTRKTILGLSSRLELSMFQIYPSFSTFRKAAKDMLRGLIWKNTDQKGNFSDFVKKPNDVAVAIAGSWQKVFLKRRCADLMLRQSSAESPGMQRSSNARRVWWNPLGSAMAWSLYKTTLKDAHQSCIVCQYKISSQSSPPQCIFHGVIILLRTGIHKDCPWFWTQEYMCSFHLEWWTAKILSRCLIWSALHHSV